MKRSHCTHPRSLVCISRLPYFSLSSTTMGLQYSTPADPSPGYVTRSMTGLKDAIDTVGFIAIFPVRKAIFLNVMYS